MKTGRFMQLLQDEHLASYADQSDKAQSNSVKPVWSGLRPPLTLRPGGLAAKARHNSVAQCGRVWLYFLLGIVHEAGTRDEFILWPGAGRRVSLCREDPDDRV